MKHNLQFKFKQLETVLDYLYNNVWNDHQEQVEHLEVLLAELEEIIDDN